MEHKDLRILVIDDEPVMADSLRTNLIDEGYSVDTAATGAEAIELFDQGGHHLAICDLQLPDMDGLEVMRHMKDARPTTEVIVVTGYGSVARAVEATKAGAFYFVEKPFDFEEIQPLVDKRWSVASLLPEAANRRRQLSNPFRIFNIIGASKAMHTIYETIESVAKSDANVLMSVNPARQRVIANAIHYHSLRSKKPFIKVNCAALPKELIESELFGHTKGAFHGAQPIRKSWCRMPPAVLSCSTKSPRCRLNCSRTLAVTARTSSYRKNRFRKDFCGGFPPDFIPNRPPADAIRDGVLRDDLFYRISTITIHLPPLRERKEEFNC